MLSRLAHCQWFRPCPLSHSFTAGCPLVCQALSFLPAKAEPSLTSQSQVRAPPPHKGFLLLCKKDSCWSRSHPWPLGLPGCALIGYITLNFYKCLFIPLKLYIWITMMVISGWWLDLRMMSISKIPSENLHQLFNQKKEKKQICVGQQINISFLFPVGSLMHSFLDFLHKRLCTCSFLIWK